MIPTLTQSPGLLPEVRQYLDVLRQQGFKGDIATDYAARLALATDNSIYQNLPAAIVFPRSEQDIILLTTLAKQTRFGALSFTARGGGTGTNGQSLNSGIIVDLSRHMNKILDIDPQQGWVRVQPGVVKDQLNQWLKPYGYFFAPELSTSNRATIGGMINTDASGQGSLVYGKTSDHVLGLRAVLMDGELIETSAEAIDLAHQKAQQNTRLGDLYRQVLEPCLQQRAQILETFPKLNRFMTGYDLRHVLSDDLKTFDLGRVLCGSEGTLAFITEARLNILPIPQFRCLINLKYHSFDAALRHAPWLVKAKALSVETLDSTILALARQDIIWHSVQDLIAAVPGHTIQGLNIVEYAGNDREVIQQQVTILCQQLDQRVATGEAGVIGYQVCHSLPDVERIYAMRKKAVGLLGNTQGKAKPVAFIEDTAVPPEHLADYISEFRALLDKHQLAYGMFGHVDAGVLHVRPVLDMCDPEQQRLIRHLTADIVQLTRRYHGVLWGEHGKGYRGSYTETYLGPQLFHLQRGIKAAFDADNRLNPGKICTPRHSDAPLLAIDSARRGDADRQIAVDVRQRWRGAMECNGNGLCFNFDQHTPLCPSMKITGDRVHSPKGRATLVREWLRLLSQQGVDLIEVENKQQQAASRSAQLLSKVVHSWRAKQGDYDFSHEVKQAMDGCLACKACSTQCPVKIDVPAFRSRFLSLYHSRYLRSPADHLVAKLEQLLPRLSHIAPMINWVMRQRLTKYASRQYLGLVDLPALSVPPLRQQLVDHPTVNTPLAQLKLLSAAERQQYVLIVQDPFTSFYEAELIADAITLISALGFKPVLLPFKPNGKAQHVKGFLGEFTQTAIRTRQFLSQIATLSMPMLGVDPALVLCYRQEYQSLAGAEHEPFHVQLMHEWLSSIMTDRHSMPTSAVDPTTWYLFSHCTETAVLPDSGRQWQQIFQCFGAKLELIATGCCGMAGTYGHEVKNQQNSQGIFALSWQPKLADLPLSHCLATGYSCRSQVKRFTQSRLDHPLQALLSMIKQNPVLAETSIEATIQGD